MANLNPYLSFDGKCKEAMKFYKECFGGDLSVMKVGDTPIAKGKTDAEKEEVMHSALLAPGITLFASDMISGDKQVRGNTISLCLNFDTIEEAQLIFDKLSVGATIGHPLKQEFWGDIYGDLEDKYGFDWMFNVVAKKD